MKKHLLVLSIASILMSCSKKSPTPPSTTTNTVNSITVNYTVKYGQNDSIGYQIGKVFKTGTFTYSITLPSNTGHYFEVYGSETGGTSYTDSIQMQVLENGTQISNQKALGNVYYYISE